ncbi:alpha/beta hydrolase [Urechidicola vernalis]|uniref:Alpha/beta hydrolase-fold protein n=1 Tax=Urechidicola vernalis TaxID=3075600 RepID=A0ABU2Y3U9_9FLAO|nr:alpha/beta hydrolase-fold protein [Urechidicola sp. P050]MDT0552491.1 alpha/beta hydrolase-fold protein [Urechidicola sp. P050]
MKKILFLICICITSIIQGQNTITTHLDSYELEEQREIKIYVPPSYEIDSTRYYPLTIVFDADYMFDVVVGNSILFAKKDKAPEQIVVGISQPGDIRYHDCAYDKLTSYPTGRSEFFYRFVRSELANFMEQNYRISPFKTIVGNTITANFANYFFIEDDPDFNAFISINPYFATDMPTLLDANIAQIKNNNYYYYLSTGDYNSEKRNTVIESANAALSSKNNPKFNYKFDNLAGATLTSSIGQSIPSAMAFIFEMYSSISKKEFDERIKNLSPPDAIAYLENKYVDIEYLFGTNLKMREKDIYAIESIVIDKENGEYLRDFGEMIYKLFPESHLGDYYIGLDFEFRGRYKQALQAYKEGYMKITSGIEDADNFYKNVERVVGKMK